MDAKLDANPQQDDVVCQTAENESIRSFQSQHIGQAVCSLYSMKVVSLVPEFQSGRIRSSLHAGETQTSPSQDDVKDILDVLVDTQQYIYDKASVRPAVLKTCTNQHSLCSFWKARGDCSSKADFMNKDCPAACQKCR